MTTATTSPDGPPDSWVATADFVGDVISASRDATDPYQPSDISVTADECRDREEGVHPLDTIEGNQWVVFEAPAKPIGPDPATDGLFLLAEVVAHDVNSDSLTLRGVRDDTPIELTIRSGPRLMSVLTRYGGEILLGGDFDENQRRFSARSGLVVNPDQTVIVLETCGTEAFVVAELVAEARKLGFSGTEFDLVTSASSEYLAGLVAGS